MESSSEAWDAAHRSFLDIDRWRPDGLMPSPALAMLLEGTSTLPPEPNPTTPEADTRYCPRCGLIAPAHWPGCPASTNDQEVTQ